MRAGLLPRTACERGADALLGLTPSFLFLYNQVCYLLLGDKWVRMSDEDVEVVDKAEVLEVEAFMLFYLREPRVVPFSTEFAANIDVARFQAVSVYAGARALKRYPVPNNIHDMIEGGKSAGFNPWKVQTNWRTRLHELLFLEEAQQVDRHQHHQRRRDRHTHATATATSAPHHRHQHPTPPPPPPPPPATPRTLLPPPHGGRRSSRERTTCTA